MNKYQLSQQLNEQLEKVAQQNNLTLFRLKDLIFDERHYELIKGEVENALYFYPDIIASEEDKEAITEQALEYIYCQEYSIATAVEQAINKILEI